MATLTLKKPTLLRARGKLIYEPTRMMERDNGKVVAGRKRTEVRDGQAISPWWIILQVSDTIADYYRWWVEREIYHPVFRRMNDVHLGKPMWGAHVTVLDGRNVVPADKHHLWKKYDGEMVEFEYSPAVYRTWKFWSIPARSTRLDEIREELGFPAYDPRLQDRVPGFNYHITVGRMD